MQTNKIKVELVSWHGGDARIAAKAWVSTENGANRTEGDIERLVKFLYREGHSQPFMASGVAFRVEGPYRTLVQIIRHMTAHPCEAVDLTDTSISTVQASARYGAVSHALFRDLNPEDYSEHLAQVDELFERAESCISLWHEINSKLKGKQNDIRDDINNCLPQGLMGCIDIDFNLWSFRNFILKRTDPHAQKTVREIAYMMMKRVTNIPELKAFNESLAGEVYGKA